MTSIPPIRLVAITVALLFVLAACGTEEAVTVPADDTPQTTDTPAEDNPSEGNADDPDTDDTDDTDESDGEAMTNNDDGAEQTNSSDYQPTKPTPNMTALTVHLIDDVVVAEDGLSLAVRYMNAAEPCSGGILTVEESEASVMVTLETGLHPNAAAMTCINEVSGFELSHALNAALGDRELVVAVPEPTESPTDSSSDDELSSDGLSPADAFVGLSLEEAEAKAEQEGRPWRIGRLDDESFALTEDYNPDRVTFEVDKNIVTLSHAG